MGSAVLRSFLSGQDISPELMECSDLLHPAFQRHKPQSVLLLNYVRLLQVHLSPTLGPLWDPFHDPMHSLIHQRNHTSTALTSTSTGRLATITITTIRSTASRFQEPFALQRLLKNLTLKDVILLPYLLLLSYINKLTTIGCGR